MARRLRIIQQGYCYHTIIRGNDGESMFRDNRDRARFCLLLQEATEKNDIEVHAFCLMSNHVHLVLQPKSEKFSDGMHTLSFRYAQYFNRRYDRKGHLFQGRFKAIFVQSGAYLRQLVRYVHLNPVRAGMTKEAKSYRWSSHQAYVLRQEYTWLQQELVLGAFGDSTEKAREKLMVYVDAPDKEARTEAIEIRKSLRKGAYGDIDFMLKWCQLLQNQTERMEPSPTLTFDRMAELVCDELEISKDELCSRARTAPLVEARTVMVCLAQRLKMGSFADLGSFLLKDATTLSRLAFKARQKAHIHQIVNKLAESLPLWKA